MQAIYTLCILHVLVGDDLTTASAPSDYEPCIIYSTNLPFPRTAFSPGNEYYVMPS